eukprot:15444500-Alexandrium_andersonii.AAC.1
MCVQPAPWCVFRMRHARARCNNYSLRDRQTKQLLCGRGKVGRVAAMALAELAGPLCHALVQHGRLTDAGAHVRSLALPDGRAPRGVRLLDGPHLVEAVVTVLVATGASDTGAWLP